jgi:hypothetical protein
MQTAVSPYPLCWQERGQVVSDLRSEKMPPFALDRCELLPNHTTFMYYCIVATSHQSFPSRGMIVLDI